MVLGNRPLSLRRTNCQFAPDFKAILLEFEPSMTVPALRTQKGRGEGRTKERSGLGMRGGIKRAPLSTRDIVPEGARFIDGTYSNPAGSRANRLFIPSRYQAQPLPLVVMLHGSTQSPDDFAAGTR